MLLSRNKCREDKVYDHISSSKLGQNQKRIANKLFENVAKFRYLGMTQIRMTFMIK
jgi:diphthamide synthase subunit DPH2